MLQYAHQKDFGGRCRQARGAPAGADWKSRPLAGKLHRLTVIALRVTGVFAAVTVLEQIATAPASIEPNYATAQQTSAFD